MNRYLLLFVFITTSNSFAQSAWTKKKGEVYVQLAFNTISNYNEIFGKPDYQTEREITDNTLQLFGEYGITNKTTLIISVPLKLITTDDLTTNNNSPFTTAESKTSLGNIEIGLKHRFYNAKWIIAWQMNIEARTSSFYKASGIQTGYDAWAFTPTLNASRSYKSYYVQAFMGLNIKTHDYSSNLKIGGEIGSKLKDKIWLIAYLDVIKSFNNGDIELPQSNYLTALYINDQEYGGFGLKAIVDFSKTFGATANFGGAFFGNNVAKQVALNIGLYYKL